VGSVVPLHAPSGPVAAFGRAERSFLCCSCSVDDETGWIPVIISESTGWRIHSLVCLGCAREMRITNGREAVGR
jgi:hypothetical protein